MYIAMLGIAPLVWAPYATAYGRRPIYLTSIPIAIGGSIGVALSHNLGTLIATRVIQAIGSSSVLCVGAGSIGDIFRPTERGRAMGVFYGGVLFGPALAPVVAGILTQYARGPQGSWRAVQWLIVAMGALSAGLCIFFLPETIHARGVERTRAARRRARGADCEGGARGGLRACVEGWGWVWLNPLQPMGLLRYPNLLAVSLNSSFVLLSTYCLLVPLTYTLGPRYGITNAAILGSLYLATGAGNIIGARIAGRLSDRAVRVWMARRGARVPEDRLRASVIAGGVVVPLSLLGTGLTMQFWTGRGGLALSLVWLAVSGIGLMGVLSVNNTYLVDVMQGRSAELIAVNNCIRYLCSAGASAAVLPLIEAVGIAPTNALAAGVSWAGFALVLATIRWGRAARERVDAREASARAGCEDAAGVMELGEREEREEREKEGAEAETMTAGDVQASRRTSMTLREA